MKVLGVIPARYASSRFPGKPLALILGKPMIQWVYERASQAEFLDHVIVATDDKRIFDTVINFGGTAEMTSASLKNGTERVTEVARKYDSSLIVNIQGDEPAIDPIIIDQLIQLLKENPDSVAGTLVRKIDDPKDLINVNIPKVIIDKEFNALYFSRSVIPFNRDAENQQDWLNNSNYYQHIGLYIYQRDFLLKFVEMPESELEKTEQLEQLRILENCYKIKVSVIESKSIGVDVPEDIILAEKFLSGSQV